MSFSTKLFDSCVEVLLHSISFNRLVLDMTISVPCVPVSVNRTNNTSQTLDKYIIKYKTTYSNCAITWIKLYGKENNESLINVWVIYFYALSVYDTK